MGLIEMIMTIAVVGLVVWAITTLIPMPQPFKSAIYVLSVVGLAFYIISAIGVMPHFHDVHLGK